MSIATGIFKQLRYKKESTINTPPSTASAQLMRRVTSNLSLVKNTYRSNEIRTDAQRSMFRHGTRSVDGTINGELSVGTYADFMETILRDAFAAVPASTDLTVTVTASAPNFVVSDDGTGTFITDGFKIGMVIRLASMNLNAANVAKNLLIISLTEDALTVHPLNGVAMVAEASKAATTVTVIGKVVSIPQSGHTNDSYSIEHWHSDVNQSELFTGCRVSKMDIKLPATGLATIDIGVMGMDMTPGAAEYYASGSLVAASTGDGFQAVNGALYVEGVAVGLITGMDISINPNMSKGEVVGSNLTPDVFAGAIDVTGNMTVYFQDATIRNYFVNETEVSVVAAFSTGNEANADFITFVMTRVKVGGASKDDGDKGLVMTMPYVALLDIAGGAAAATTATTISIQDSSL